MGVYTDLLANAKSWDSTTNAVATDRVITMELERFRDRQGDMAYPSGYDEADEVQEVGTYNGVVSSGNFSLTLLGLTTANIAYDADAAAIEGAIDTVATGNVTDWVNGDVSVALVGDLTANAATLIYSGNSVDATNQPLVVMTDVDLGGGGTVGNMATVTNGQTARTTLAALNAMGIITSSPPPQGTTVGIVARAKDTHPWWPRQESLKALAEQAALDDGTDEMYTTLMSLWGY